MAEQETWATALERLALLLGGRSEQFQAEAEEWLRQSIRALRWGDSIQALTRTERAVAFQRFLCTIDDLAGEGEFAFAFAADHRFVVARAFARNFCTDLVGGPEWRLSPDEADVPTYAEYVDDALPI